MMWVLAHPLAALGGYLVTLLLVGLAVGAAAYGRGRDRGYEEGAADERAEWEATASLEVRRQSRAHRAIDDVVDEMPVTEWRAKYTPPGRSWRWHVLSECPDEGSCPIHGRNEPPGLDRQVRTAVSPLGELGGDPFSSQPLPGPTREPPGELYQALPPPRQPTRRAGADTLIRGWYAAADRAAQVPWPT